MADNIVDDTSWVIKTHHPNPKGPGNKDFIANKCIVCVRNPFDVIISCFHFALACGSHSVAVDHDPFAPENSELFNKFIEDKIRKLNEWMDCIY